MLAEAGWKDTDGDGILDRNGIPLKFTVIYPKANPIYPRLLPIVRQDMAKIGVKMELLGWGTQMGFDSYKAFYRDHYNPWAAEHIHRM